MLYGPNRTYLPNFEFWEAKDEYFLGLKMDHILVYLYPNLFYLTNTYVDADVSWMHEFISIFILNKLDTN